MKKCLFLGLLISDGNVFKDKTGRQASISITLDLKDSYMLDKFKETVNNNTSIGRDGRGCRQIAVRSNVTAKDLAQYDVTPRKSFSIYLPILEGQWMPHLIRDILEGDGSIFAKSNKNNDFLHYISFCGTHKLIQNIADYIFKNLELKRKPTVYDYKDRSLSEIKVQSQNDMYIFREQLYKNANIFLVRKKNIYNHFKEHYGLN